MTYESIAITSQTVSAFLFAAILVWIWVKYVSPAIRVAQEAENKHIALAEQHLEESKAALSLLRAEIDGAEHDAELIRRRADELAAFEREAAIASARETGERALHNASGELDRARAAGRVRLRTELLDRALEIARSQATLRANAAIDSELIRSFVTSVERGGNRG